MIIINGQPANAAELFKEIANSEPKKIIEQMASYPIHYHYQTLTQLKFELKFRDNTLKAATDLYNSGAKFTTFKYSFCNKKYWNRLDNGGFLLHAYATPSIALLDILENGHLYAFECSTAMAIVLYMTVLYTNGQSAFNKYFQGLYLMNWQFDEDLPVYQHTGEDFISGDILYFKNPDFDPKKPHWRGENAIYFGNDRYYGHGIGITSSSTIINHLNKKRRPNPNESAYLTRLITRPLYPNISLLT